MVRAGSTIHTSALSQGASRSASDRMQRPVFFVLPISYPPVAVPPSAIFCIAATNVSISSSVV